MGRARQCKLLAGARPCELRERARQSEQLSRARPSELMGRARQTELLRLRGLLYRAEQALMLHGVCRMVRSSK